MSDAYPSTCPSTLVRCAHPMLCWMSSNAIAQDYYNARSIMPVSVAIVIGIGRVCDASAHDTIMLLTHIGIIHVLASWWYMWKAVT